MNDTTPRRVRLLFTADPALTLVAGSEGTVEHVDDVQTVHVRWDNGAIIGLLPHCDVWAELCTRCGEAIMPGCCPSLDSEDTAR